MKDAKIHGVAEVAIRKGFYPIVDVTTLKKVGADLLTFSKLLVKAKPVLLQLRAKCNQDICFSGDQKMEKLALSLRDLCGEYAVPFVVNDDVALAQKIGAEYVHVGQTDCPIPSIRKLAPGLRIGVSTHHLEQVKKTAKEGPDYLAFGPIFKTKSKVDAELETGIKSLHMVANYMHKHHIGLPVVAIGGIELGHALEIWQHADWIALIGALVSPNLAEVEAKAQTWAELCSRFV